MAKPRAKSRTQKAAPRGMAHAKVKAKPKLKAKPAAAKAKGKARMVRTPARKAPVKAVAKRRAVKTAVRRPARPAPIVQNGAAPQPHSIAANVPSYDQLPVREGAPAGSAWGVFGDDDQVGTINLMTPERVKVASAFIRSGRVFALNLPIDVPDPPLFTRGKHRHTIKQFSNFILDDYLDNFYPQASSQWDALCHVKHPRLGGYNGVPDSEITGYGGSKLGIDNLARRGIAGRGVLADIGRYYERYSKPIDYSTNDVVPLEDLVATLESQKSEIWPGDVLLIRIGWTRAYRAMSEWQKADLARETKTPGIEGSARTAKWLWDQHLAAVASDSPALEAVPPPSTGDFMESNDLLHFHMLSFFGMPIGEMWNLEELAEDCAGDGRYEFFFTSAPLNIPGGVGSPPNALAVK
ncbi:MAG TPA: cyclase family protein [Candidatus Binataceae bacterium]|nr:cyclase family protein [Candidatus Binataceae bacterium]